MLQVQTLFVLLLVLYTSSQPCWRGVNLSGMEFGSAVPGRYQKDYTSPTPAEVDYFMGKGMNVFRYPFKWERLQPSAGAPLNQTYLGYIDDFVKYATGKGAYVLIDPHNYARYFDKVIGDGVDISAFADLWQKLATHYLSNQNVIFGLMNEPHDMKTELWLSGANAAIAAIRSTGAKQTITVPGNGWTGAWSWTSNGYGTSNSVVMQGVKDPLNKFIFEVHQYLDTDGSGTHDACVGATVGSQRLASFTAWCRQFGYQAFLGEWAGGRNQLCYDAISDITDYMDKNKDIYIGWTWWGGGPWWGTYIFALDPANGQDQPQMQYLTPHLHC